MQSFASWTWGVIEISLRETRKKELKEVIFRQAISLFKEKGYENVTVEDITSACGIAKGTFYNYFVKKENVLLHLGQTQLEVLREGLVRHAGVKNIRERLRLIFLDLMARMGEDPDLIRATIIETMKSSEIEEEIKLEEEAHQVLIPLFQEAIRDGQVSGRWSPHYLSSVAVGMYNHVLMTWLAKKERTDMASVFDMYIEVLWNGIGKNGKGETGAE